MVSALKGINISESRIIHVTEGLNLSLGGTTQFVTALCQALSSYDLRVEVWAPDAAGEASISIAPGLSVRRLEIGRPTCLSRSPGLHAALNSLNPKPTLLHQHGLWLDIYRVTSRFARRYDIPLVISLHGMLEPWAIRRSRWKKKLAWIVFQGQAIRAAACLHVTTHREAQHLRALGIKVPIAVIPNGLSLISDKGRVGHEGFFNRYPSLSGKNIVLFLGRIHPVKGLDLFARAWARVANEFENWQWVIAGPDEGGYREELLMLFDQLAISDRVTILDPIYGLEKYNLLRDSELVVLPSRMESFGMVVLEALHAKTPVMASKECPWPELDHVGCGWWVKHDTDCWERTLRQAMSLEEHVRREMGVRGSRLVKDRYTEKSLVSSMIGVYEWVLGKRTVPSYVHTQ